MSDEAGHEMRSLRRAGRARCAAPCGSRTGCPRPGAAARTTACARGASSRCSPGRRSRSRCSSSAGARCSPVCTRPWPTSRSASCSPTPTGLVLNRLRGDTSLLRAWTPCTSRRGSRSPSARRGPTGWGSPWPTGCRPSSAPRSTTAPACCAYTCAAVPVLDPLSGRLEGSVNITTWARSSSRAAAGPGPVGGGQHLRAHAGALAGARAPRPTPRGEVFRVEHGRLEPGVGTVRDLGPAWTGAAEARSAPSGPPGAGRPGGRRARCRSRHAAGPGGASGPPARPDPLGATPGAGGRRPVAGAVGPRAGQGRTPPSSSARSTSCPPGPRSGCASCSPRRAPCRTGARTCRSS